MAVNKSFLFLCVFTCLCSVTCDLNLKEDSSCVTRGINGTCVGIYKCNSAALTYIYSKAGFDLAENTLPELPDICSYKNEEPIVCCTDCDIGEEKFRNSAIGTNGIIVNREGPISWGKCLDYFQSLPYPCRGYGNIQVEKIWNEDKKCHDYDQTVALGVVGGRDARRSEFPHLALLGYGDDAETAQWLCGGSVISERFILTAAHCTSTRALGNISYAALGLLKRSDPVKDWNIHKVKSIIVHPEYVAPSKYHDIALVETETQIKFAKDLLPACLDPGFSYPKPSADAIGWGRQGHRQDLADILQVVSLEEFNETECAGIYRPHRHLKNGYDHEKQMCYGSHKQINDTCEGDSGGPLQLSDFKCQYTIIGVTSYGKDCGILGSAGMYTRVAYYIPWIESVVWPEETEARKKTDNEWLDKWLSK